MEADIICSVLVMRYLSGRNTCFLSLANVYLAVCGLTRTLQPVFSPVRFRLLSMFPTSPTGNRDSSKNMIERTAVTLFFCLFLFLWFPYINPSLWANCMIITGLSRLWAGNVNIPLPSKKGTRVVFYRWNILWTRKATSAMLRYLTKHPVHSESQWCWFFNRYGMYPLSYVTGKALSAPNSGWITWKNPLKQM